MNGTVPDPRLRDTLGQTVLNALLRTRQQPNSGALALEVADALMPVVAAELARVKADSEKRAAEELEAVCRPWLTGPEMYAAARRRIAALAQPAAATADEEGQR